MEIQIKGELPKSLKELQQLVIEEYRSHNSDGASAFRVWDKFSNYNHTVTVSYIRHHYTDYDELVKDVRDYDEYLKIRRHCNAKAEELLAKIKGDNDLLATVARKLSK